MTMLRKCIRLCAVLAVGSLGLSAALGDVSVGFDAQDSVILTPGQTVLVDVVADMSDPILAWGLDVTVADPGIATWELISIGANWIDPGTTIDGDGLAGLAFPTGLTGHQVLATLRFTGHAEGITGIGLNDDYPTQEDEGFAMDPSGMATVLYGVGTIEVLPEPTTLVLLSLGLALIRRR